MRKLSSIVVACVSICLVGSGTAYAGHIDLPVKWSQLPDMDTGVDQYSVHLGNAVCSNNFECTDDRLIEAVR